MRTRTHSRNFPLWGAVALGLFLLVFVGGSLVSNYLERETVTTTVNDKERVCTGSTDGRSDCKYLIFTDAGTFEVSDSILMTRFNSSDLYGTIEKGKTYRITTIGWRIPILSQYPNIEKVREAPR